MTTHQPSRRHLLAALAVGVPAGTAVAAELIGASGDSGGNAVPRTPQDKTGDTISVKDFGAKGNGSADDTAAIQAAMDHASSLSDDDTVQIMLPAGVYTVTPATLARSYIGSPPFGTTLKYALRMKSNVRIIGNGATIRVADNVSSRASPQNFAVFYSEEALSNVKFDGITFDLNARNNYFSPDPTNTRLAQERRYYRYHQAAIFWEGNSGRADDVTISGCTFKNQGGVSVIICGRVGSAGSGGAGASSTATSWSSGSTLTTIPAFSCGATTHWSKAVSGGTR